MDQSELDRLKKEKDLFNEALEKALTFWSLFVCMQNPLKKFGDPGRCGVVLIPEYRKGTYRIHLGNIFSGIPNDGAVEDFNSLDELLSVWKVD
jgi:hypothetical protein